MKICFISTFPPVQCGIGTYTQMLCEQLSKHHKIFVLTLKNGKILKKRNLQVLPLWFDFGSSIDLLQKQIEKISPDVIHIQHDYTRFSPKEKFLEFLSKLKNYPLIVTLHAVLTRETSLFHPYCEELNKKIGKLAHIIIHHLSAKNILLRQGISRRKIHVIPHGTLVKKISVKKKDYFGMPKSNVILLQVGFLKRQKQHHLAIKAMPYILSQNQNVHLFICGSIHPYYRQTQEYKDYVEYCRNLIKKLKLEKHVHLRNKFLSHNQLLAYLAAADIVLFTEKSDYASASGTFHLALGQGKPVIATRIMKYDEEINQNISNEIMILPDDFKKLAKLVTKYLTDKNFTQFIKRKIENYAQKTSWERVAILHSNLYRKFAK